MKRRPIILSIDIDNVTNISRIKFREKFERYGITKENIDKSITQLDLIENTLKHMNRDQIVKLYEEFNKEIDELKIEYTIIDDKDREIIEILLPDKLAGIKFYRSTGTSRDSSLKGLWFPTSGKDFSGRLEKLEDKYLSAIEYFKKNNKPEQDILIKEMLSNDIILKFGRFITKDNLLISGYLYKNFMEKIQVGGKRLKKIKSKLQIGGQDYHINYYTKYLKYKQKYLQLKKNMIGGTKKDKEYYNKIIEDNNQMKKAAYLDIFLTL